MPNWIVSNNADMLAKAYLSDEDDFDQSDTLGGTASVSKRVRPDGPTPSAWHFASILVLVSLVVSGSMLSSIALEHKLQTPFTIPSLPEQNPCEHATARPSWHSLPLHRRHGYKRAVERLTTLPSRLGLNTSLYDDFTYIHVQLIWYTHHAAISLPYHRYFLSIFEKTLRIEGGYDQPIPFWDWTLDAEQPFESPIWHEFGGFGPVIIDCVGNKSANYTEHGYQPHCVRRNFNSTAEDGVMHSHHWRREVVKDVVETSKTYAEFRSQLESGPHKHFHLGIGGEMLTASSTNGKQCLVSMQCV